MTGAKQQKEWLQILSDKALAHFGNPSLRSWRDATEPCGKAAIRAYSEAIGGDSIAAAKEFGWDGEIPRQPPETNSCHKLSSRVKVFEGNNLRTCRQADSGCDEVSARASEIGIRDRIFRTGGVFRVGLAPDSAKASSCLHEALLRSVVA